MVNEETSKLYVLKSCVIVPSTEPFVVCTARKVAPDNVRASSVSTARPRLRKRPRTPNNVVCGTRATRENIPRDAFEFQMLHGIRRDLQQALVRDGWRMRVYIPFGTEWYPYFMRRLAERPAYVFFIAKNILRS